jgi:hypothetical protein
MSIRSTITALVATVLLPVLLVTAEPAAAIHHKTPPLLRAARAVSAQATPAAGRIGESDTVAMGIAAMGMLVLIVHRRRLLR